MWRMCLSKQVQWGDDPPDPVTLRRAAEVAQPPGQSLVYPWCTTSKTSISAQYGPNHRAWSSVSGHAHLEHSGH